MSAPERFLSPEACRSLLARAMKLRTGGGDVELSVQSRWLGNLRWGRNQIMSTAESTDHHITITRRLRGSAASATTNRVDDAAVRDCVQRAERRLRYDAHDWDYEPLPGSESYAQVNLWSDATFALDATARAAVQQRLVAPAVAAKLMQAGYLEVSATGNGVLNSEGLFAYVPETRAEYSVTVRNATGTGSGWAGMDHVDWGHVDAERLTSMAIDHCQRSADPVAVEPGRYTVILEPQAVAALLRPLVETFTNRQGFEDSGYPPWGSKGREEVVHIDGAPVIARPGFSKIGERVLDTQVTLSADPADPDAPFVPFAADATPTRAATWVKDGVLAALAYDRRYALGHLSRRDPLNNSLAFRMKGGTTSMADMIRTTERGLVVSRLVNVRLLDGRTLLCEGNTADGIWLVEHGSITKPAKNFRFRESPLFAFNSLESLGTPARVLMDRPTIVPPAKVRDFNMTSLADAV